MRGCLDARNCLSTSYDAVEVAAVEPVQLEEHVGNRQRGCDEVIVPGADPAYSLGEMKPLQFFVAVDVLRRREPGIRRITVGIDAGGSPRWPSAMHGSPHRFWTDYPFRIDTEAYDLIAAVGCYTHRFATRRLTSRGGRS